MKRWLRYGLIAVVSLLIIAVEVGVILGVYFPLKEADRDNIEDNARIDVKRILRRVDETLNLIFHNLLRNAAFFRINGIFISKANYSDYIQFDSLPIRDSVESYFWLPKVHLAQLAEFQLFCSEHIQFPCFLFEIHNVTEDGNFTVAPVSPRPFYFPITYAEPPINSSTAVGFDLLSLPETKVFIDIALSSVNATASGKVSLSSANPDNPNSFGIVINQLSFITRNTSQQTVDDIEGIMLAVLHINDMFTNSINDINSDLERDNIDLFVFDVTPDGLTDNRTLNRSLLYKETDSDYDDVWFAGQAPSGYGVFQRLFTLLNRQWEVVFVFSGSYLEDQESDTPLILAITLAAIAFLINLLIVLAYRAYLMYRKRIKAEKDKLVVTKNILSYVNHEVRNPLFIIMSLIDMTIDKLKDLRDMDTVVSDLQTAYGASQLVNHIVQDLLTVRRLQEGRLPLDVCIVELAAFVNMLRKTLQVKFDEKQTVDFVVRLNDNVQNLTTDSTRLQQILINYLTNALKFTDAGVITLTIDPDGDDFVRFSVTDTGRGIEDIKKDMIFKPFSQVSAMDASRHGGAGLGLYLCKMLAEIMGGSVGFESVYGEGSTFWLMLPVSCPNNDTDTVFLQNEV